MCDAVNNPIGVDGGNDTRRKPARRMAERAPDLRAAGELDENRARTAGIKHQVPDRVAEKSNRTRVGACRPTAVGVLSNQYHVVRPQAGANLGRPASRPTPSGRFGTIRPVHVGIERRAIIEASQSRQAPPLVAGDKKSLRRAPQRSCIKKTPGLSGLFASEQRVILGAPGPSEPPDAESLHPENGIHGTVRAQNQLLRLPANRVPTWIRERKPENRLTQLPRSHVGGYAEGGAWN